MELKDEGADRLPQHGNLGQNPYNGIESYMARVGTGTEWKLGIHTMELKDPMCLLPRSRLYSSLNPYNGIESICFPSVESHCSW